MGLITTSLSKKDLSNEAFPSFKFAIISSIEKPREEIIPMEVMTTLLCMLSIIFVRVHHGTRQPTVNLRNGDDNSVQFRENPW